MTKRRVRSYGGSNRLLDALSTIFLLEAIKPSPEIYIFSPWITNSVIIENYTNNYSSLFPFNDKNEIKLSDFIELCVWRGTKCRIITRMQGGATKSFYNQMKDIAEFRKSNTEHEKAFISNNFVINGSMNFTKSGIYFNGESIVISNDKSEISKAFITANEVWGEARKI
ncbi:MAG: phospholipase D-like domain-containing protein DpdK [bacterium]